MSAYPELIVGIGASAGGLKPIEELFDHMPGDTGFAFVVIQHLSPDFKSLMDELLSRHTDMPIFKVSDGVAVERNTIYLIPPEKNMAVKDGRLLLTEKLKKPNLHLPIDNFFASLADEFGKNSVAIVLSGSGSDGSRGIQKVHEAGGFVLVQNPEAASFDGMPRAAIKTKATDITCDVQEMPDFLLKFSRYRDVEHIKEDLRTSQGDDLNWANSFFLEHFGVDFSKYKPGTIRRRIERRIQLTTAENMRVYRERVESNPEEADHLFRDLLVEVTQFFRDPDAFDLLRESIVPKLIEQAKDDEEFRAWICGCATGEEAYSIAMIIDDCMRDADSYIKPFKVFATDVHPGSIEFAGEGKYSERSLINLPEEFRSRYFVRDENGFRARQEIRQRIIFAVNDVTTDPPFTNLNLISCRNLLIYLLPQAQQQVLSRFHFGLKKNGVLFLGPSETIAELSGEFDEISRQWRFFKKRRDIRLTDERTAVIESQALRAVTGHQSLRHFQRQTLANSSLVSIVNRYVPPSLLVDGYNELIHSIGKARQLLTFPEGKPTNNVLQLLGQELSVPVSAALHRCRSSLETVVFKGVRVKFPGDEESRLLNVVVDPILEREETLFLVSFPETDSQQDEINEFEYDSIQSNGEEMEQLRVELNYTRETLQATVEELESSNEELQATNEELIASNEELQSTNEELQSTNEELHTVNQENRQRIEQLHEVTEDLELLLSRTATGIMFLDEHLNIRKFTRSITRYFDLQQCDVGRSIENFTHRTGVENFYKQLKEAAETGSEFVLETSYSESESLLIEVSVHRSENKVTGLMLTIGHKAVHGFGIGSRQFYLPVGSGFWQWPDVTKDKMWWSPKCFELLGFEEGEISPTFSSWRDLVHEDDRDRLQNAGTENCVFVQQGYLLLRMKCKDTLIRKFEYRAAFVMDKEDRPKSMMGSFATYEHPRETPASRRVKSSPIAQQS